MFCNTPHTLLLIGLVVAGVFPVIFQCFNIPWVHVKLGHCFLFFHNNQLPDTFSRNDRLCSICATRKSCCNFFGHGGREKIKING